MSEGKWDAKGAVVISFLIGGIVGAGVALLTAPQSGRRTRRQIARMTEDAVERIKSVADDAADKVKDAYKGARKMVA